MNSPGKPPRHVKLDERNHVEKPLLGQLAGLGWEVIDLTDMKQTPTDTHRESFTEFVMTPVLRERLRVINPWLEDDQVEGVVKELTASFLSTGFCRIALRARRRSRSKSRRRSSQTERVTADGTWAVSGVARDARRCSPAVLRLPVG